MDTILYWLKRLLPRQILNYLRPPYHLALAWLGDKIYHHPSRKLTIIAVTGTKGKSTTVELISAILSSSGVKTASLSTIQFKIDDDVKPNLYKMTTPGRFFVQKFLRDAADAGCTHAVLEMTSEGAKQFRHRFIDMDALVFTNLSPEHIESHGSFAKYKEAKLSIARALEKSPKRPRYVVANVDDEHGKDFLNIAVEKKLPYSLDRLELHTLHKDSLSLVLKEDGEEISIRVPLVGLFNVYNSLAAITLTRALDVPWRSIEKALGTLSPIHGRVEHIYSPQDLDKKIVAVVDYAHTPDSLEKLYQAFKDVPKICILGNTGGGRDHWKRPEMGAIADQYCDRIILTNEDPYDEDPRKILEEMSATIKNKSKLDIIMDRRLAIRTALTEAQSGDYIIISGKGTDPYIMGPHNTKEKWSDAEVVREEMESLKN